MNKNNFKGDTAGKPMSVDLSKSVPYICDNEECGNDVFMPAMKFRKISKLVTGTKEDQLIPVQVFMCTSCGNINKEFDLNV